MGASQEIIRPLREHRLDISYGSYLREEQVEVEAPRTYAKWQQWLAGQTDPGNYESYKVIRDGKIEWVCDVFMPAELVKNLKAEVGVDA